MLEPIMEETSEDEEYALNSWQNHHQHQSHHEQSTFNHTVTSGVSLWSSPESETGSVIRIELNKGNSFIDYWVNRYKEND